MKKSTRLTQVMAVTIALFLAIGATSCGKKGGKKISENAKKLMAHSWKMDPNATIKGTTDQVEDTTGIKADIQLNGDVGDFANFVAETIVFGEDTKDKTKLSYQRTIGEGILSSSVLGYWSMGADDKTIILREWDATKGEERAPVTYKIIELTDSKLVWQKEGDVSSVVYNAK